MARIKGYKFGVEWIALNESIGTLDAEEAEGLISVALLADLFGKTPARVVRDVWEFRTNSLDKTCGYKGCPNPFKQKPPCALCYE